MNNLRIPTHNLAEFYEYISGVYNPELISQIHQVHLALRGKTSLMSVYSPDGVRLEFYESLDLKSS